MRTLITALLVLIFLPAAEAAELTRLVRLKIAAGDLYTGAHAAEEHRNEKGADSEYWDAIGWLARGAQMFGKPDLARAYVAELQRAIPAETKDLLTPYGAAIEVEGRLIAEEQGRGAAIRYFLDQLAKAKATSLRSRISKNIDLLTLEGQPAPDIDGKLEAMRGKPVLLYFFAEWCGDCKAQSSALERIWSRYGDRIGMIAVTRLYDDEKPEEEKAQVAKVWREVYDGLAGVPVVIDTDTMVRYGASATPTFALVDQRGIVQLYTPTRLSEAELTERIESALAASQQGR